MTSRDTAPMFWDGPLMGWDAYLMGLGACVPGNSGVAHAVLPNDESAACGEPLEIVLPLRTFEGAVGQCEACVEAVRVEPGRRVQPGLEWRRAVLTP